MTQLIQLLNSVHVRYLLIGGQAMRLLGMPRYTMDWDLFIPPRDDSNFEKLNQILGEELDLPLVPLGPRGENFIQTYQTTWGVIQFHLGIPGLPGFDLVEKRAASRETEDGVRIPCLSGDDMLASKIAAGRPQDQPDVQFLQELKRLGKLS